MTKEQIVEVLKTVTYPGFSKDIVTFNFVKNIEVSNNAVSISLEITSSAPEVKKELEDDIRQKISSLGITNINVVVNQPKMPRETSSKGKNLAPHIKNFVMVSSGKGGVGKSTTTVNLAVASAMQGKRVGILDADIYGPNIPRMLGCENAKPSVRENKVFPVKAHGVDVISMGILMEAGQAIIWRGPMIMKAIEQFFTDIVWDDLDILFIDMPPGTGDAQLSLAQSVPVSTGVVVTTPQVVALDDAKRGLDMFEKLHIPIAGIVENMSGFICPDTGKEYDIFGKGTTQELAKAFKTTVIAEVPIEPAIREGGDSGRPIVAQFPDSESAKRYLKASERLWDHLCEVNAQGAVDNSGIQPIPSGKSACSM